VIVEEMQKKKKQRSSWQHYNDFMHKY